MRLHTVTIEAFGAFAEQTVVDFDAVSADGLFAITGPTGAGKTTILDAVCFALYNRVPGQRQQAGQLRSHHAAPTTPSRVVLEYSAAGRRYRIERTPQYERPKVRGTGTMTQRHTVSISVLREDGWAGLARTAGEADAVVADTIGLTAAQFTKLILLPQGDFTAFLHADSGQRKDILERLFDTERFTRIERILAERAKEARSALGRTGERRRALVDAADSLSWDRPPARSDGFPSAADVRAAYASATSRAAEGRETCEIIRAAAAQIAAAQQKTADERAQRASDVAALAELEELEAEWEAGDADRRRRSEALSAGERAADLRARIESARDAANRRSAAQTAAAASERSAAQTRRSAQERLGAELDDLSTAELRGAASALIRRAEALSARRRAEAAVAEAEEAAARTRTASDDADTRLSRARDIAAQARADSDLRRAEVDTTADADAALAEAQRLRSAATVAQRARTAAEEADARSAATAAAAADARTDLAALRTRMSEQAAGRLAAELADGQPCPVCGSCEHPHPQTQSPSDAVEADLEAAEVRAEEAERADQSAQRAAAAAAERLRRAEDDLGGLPPETVDARVREAQALSERRARLRSVLEESLRTERAAAAELDAAQTASSDRRDDRARAQAALSAARARADAASDSLGDHDASVLASAGIPVPDDEQSARAGAEALSSAAAAADAAAADAAALAQAQAVADSAAQTLDGELERAGFADLTAWERAADVDLAALRRRADEDSAARRSIDALAASAEVLRARSAGDTTESLERLAADSAAAARSAASSAENLDRAEAALIRTSLILERTEEARRSAEHEIEESEARIDALGEDIALSELARGTDSSGTRLSLSSYALLALFAEVADAASVRLRSMTQNRYSLVHEIQPAKRESSAGLGLRIVDDYTEESRDPRSLSGGESFIAALSLALGLADTVAATSGGLALDMLFLDEGFGSLDADSLDDVLAVLDELRTGGRTIGVISHVPAMQEAISAQILVHRSPTGSRVEHIDGAVLPSARVGTGSSRASRLR